MLHNCGSTRLRRLITKDTKITKVLLLKESLFVFFARFEPS